MGVPSAYRVHYLDGRMCTSSTRSPSFRSFFCTRSNARTTTTHMTPLTQGRSSTSHVLVCVCVFIPEFHHTTCCTDDCAYIVPKDWTHILAEYDRLTLPVVWITVIQMNCPQNEHKSGRRPWRLGEGKQLFITTLSCNTPCVCDLVIQTSALLLILLATFAKYRYTHVHTCINVIDLHCIGTRYANHVTHHQLIFLQWQTHRIEHTAHQIYQVQFSIALFKNWTMQHHVWQK